MREDLSLVKGVPLEGEWEFFYRRKFEGNQVLSGGGKVREKRLVKPATY